MVTVTLQKCFQHAKLQYQLPGASQIRFLGSAIHSLLSSTVLCKWTNMICIGVPWLYAMKLIFWTCGKGKLGRIHVESYGPGCFSLFRTRIKVQLPFEMGSKPTKLHHFLSKIWAILENRSTSPKSWGKMNLWSKLGDEVRRHNVR